MALKFKIPETIGGWPQKLVEFTFLNSSFLITFFFIELMRLLLKKRAAGETFFLIVGILVAFNNSTIEFRHPQTEVLSYISFTMMPTLTYFIFKRWLEEFK